MAKIRRCMICSNTNRTAFDVSYFRIPADQDYAEKWFINLRKLDLYDSLGGRNANGFICSDHFPPDRMFVSKTGDQSAVRRLKRGALPYKITDDGQIEDPISDKSDDDADESFDCSIADMIQKKMFSEDEPSGMETNGYADNEMSNNDLDEDFNLDLFDDVDPKEIEQYKSHFPKLEKIADSKSHCTSCQYHIGTAPINEAIIKMHPILRVTQCKRCYTFYNSGEFERGEDGSELYCRWCGQGGEVYCCSNCPYVFCRRCIVQNLSRNMVTEIQNNENWNCFACAPQCMIPLRANHWALVNFIEKQKRNVINQSSDEREINELMSKDISRCCNTSKKRLTLKRKIESTAAITPPPEKKKMIAPNTSTRVLSTPQPRKSIESNTAQEDDDSVAVQCTPDILSLFNNEEQATSPASNNPAAEAPPLRLIRREVTIRPNQPGTTRQSPPPQQPTLTPRQPTPVPRQPTPPLLLPMPQQPPVQTHSSITTHSAPTTSNPVYHTINGFRIDLNTAAQQETYRLPNGKLIQVKKQTPNVTQASATQPERSAPVTSRTPVLQSRHPTLLNRPLSLLATRPQIARSSSLAAVRVSRPQFQAPPRQPVHIQTRFVGNNQIRVMNGPIIQQLNAAPQQINPNHPPPLVFRTGHGNSPVGKARTQFEERVDSSMEVCQHIIGKINTLTNSSSYKKVKSFMDLKDLTIHLSYLLTYAIGRFKTLQEKCIEDMKSMGFDPENTGGGLPSDDDDIEIVEPKTTTINLDSDEENDVPTSADYTATNNNIDTVPSLSNGEKNEENIEPDRSHEKTLLEALEIFEKVIANNNTEDQVQNTVITSNVEDNVGNIIVEPMDVTDTTDNEKSEEKDESNTEYIVQVVEITENEEEKYETDLPESLESKEKDEPVEVTEKIPIELDQNIEKEPVKENDPIEESEPTDKTPTKVVKDNEESIEKVTENNVQLEEETETSQDGENESFNIENKKNELNVDDISLKNVSGKTETTLVMTKENILEGNVEDIPSKKGSEKTETTISKTKDNVIEDNKETDNKTVSEKLTENIDEDIQDLLTVHNGESITEVCVENGDIKSNTNKTEDNILNAVEDDMVENMSNLTNPEEISGIVPEKTEDKMTETSEGDVVESLLEILDNPELLEIVSNKNDKKLQENMSEATNNEQNINHQILSITEDKTVESTPKVNEDSFAGEVSEMTNEKTVVEPIPDLFEESSSDKIPVGIEDKSVEPIPNFSEKSSASTEDKTVEPILNLSVGSIVDENPSAIENNLVLVIPNLCEGNIIDKVIAPTEDKISDVILGRPNEAMTDQDPSNSGKALDLPGKNIEDEISAVMEIPDVPEENIIDGISDIFSDKRIDSIGLPDDIDDCMDEEPTADDDKDSSTALLDDIIMKSLEMDATV